jgi:hypothetical protein
MTFFAWSKWWNENSFSTFLFYFNKYLTHSKDIDCICISFFLSIPSTFPCGRKFLQTVAHLRSLFYLLCWDKFTPDVATQIFIDKNKCPPPSSSSSNG